jgi:hypothetical protein
VKVSQKQMDAVLALAGARRFEHFIKVVADWQEVWGLYKEGWALAAADDGATVFPLWPAKEYAGICAVNEWATYEPRSISLNDFMDVLLPKLKFDGVLPGVFFTPTSKGVTPSVDDLRLAIETELRNY